MVRLVLLFFVLSLLSSCKSFYKKNVQDVFSAFSQIHYLDNPQLVLADLYDPQNIMLMDSLLFIRESKNDPMLWAYGLSGECHASFLRKGRGPGETSNLLRICPCDKDTFQASVDPESTFVYRIDSVLNGGKLPAEQYHLPTGSFALSPVITCGEGRLLYIGRVMGDANETRFCMYDTATEKIHSFGSYPAGDKEIAEYPVDDYSKLTAYQGDICLKPDGTKAVVIYFYAVGLDILDLQCLEIETSVFYRYPQVELNYIPALKANVVKRKMDGYRGFKDVWCSDDHIYILYTAKRFDEAYNTGRYILKYDWEGNPLCVYQLSQDVSCIAIDTDETWIYAGISDDKNAQLIRYKI